MPGWAWLLIGLALVACVAVGLFVVFLLYAEKKVQVLQDELEEFGVRTTAWIIGVEPAEGLMWPIAHVLLCPDPDVPDGVMRDLARRVEAVRFRKPKDPLLAEVARLTRSQYATKNPGRQRLPDEFTGGHEVYAQYFHIDDGHNLDNLPEGALDGETFDVLVIWDHWTGMLLIPRRKKPGRRTRG